MKEDRIKLHLLLAATVFGWMLGDALLLRGEEPVPEKSEEEVEWRPLFNGESLEGWKASEFGGGGEVSVEDGRILLPQGESLTGITWDGDPPFTMDYEISLQAMRVDGGDFFCGLTFPVDDKPCSLIVGGWGGATVGLSSLDGIDASENDTTRYMTFKKGEWYPIRLRVTKDRIQTWIEDESVIDVVTKGRKVGVRPEVERSRPLGVASWRTTAALKDLKIRELSEDER